MLSDDGRGLILLCWERLANESQLEQVTAVEVSCFLGCFQGAMHAEETVPNIYVLNCLCSKKLGRSVWVN